jgi:hypothetical protein
MPGSVPEQKHTPRHWAPLVTDLQESVQLLRARGASACGAGRKSSRRASRPPRARDGRESEREVDWRRPPDLRLGWRPVCAPYARSRRRWSSCRAGWGRAGATRPSGRLFLEARAVAEAAAVRCQRNRHAARSRPGAENRGPGRVPSTHHEWEGQATGCVSSSEPRAHLRRLRGAMNQLASQRRDNAEHPELDLSRACKQYMYHMRLLPFLAHRSMLSRSEPKHRLLSLTRPDCR